MPRPGKSIRCGGAEKHGRRWRVRVFDTLGGFEDQYFEGEGAESLAREYVERFRARTAARTIGSTVTEYLDHYQRFGGTRRRPPKEDSRTLKVVRSKLVGILRLTDPVERARNRGRRIPVELPYLDRPLNSLTPNEAQRLYTARTREVSPDTHRGELQYAHAFGRWCAERGYLRMNPFEGVLPEGELSRGKDQLTVDEARRFARVAYADEHPLGGVAAVAVLTLGLRANELLDRVVRDLDDNGKILRVQFGKTANARRPVAVPPVLRSQLVRLCEGRGPDEYIFSSMTDGTLLKHVYRLCSLAGVPKVCTHALRGTQLSLTVEINSIVEAASRGAGHGDTAVTRQHYLAAGVEASARAKRMEEILLDTDDVRRQQEELAAAEKEAREAAEKLARLRAVTLKLGTTADQPYPTTPKPDLTN